MEGSITERYKRSSEIVYKMFFGLLSTVDNYLIYVLNWIHHVKKA